MNKQLIEDLRALFAEWRRLGWFDGYEPGEDPGPDADSLTDGGPAADRGPHLYAPGAGPDVKPPRPRSWTNCSSGATTADWTARASRRGPAG